MKWYRDLWTWCNFVGQDTPACSPPLKKFTDFNRIVNIRVSSKMNRYAIVQLKIFFMRFKV